MAKKEEVKKEAKVEAKSDSPQNFIPKQGDTIKTVNESEAWDKTTTVPGIGSGKKTKYGFK